jgi:uncharacterized metal-binding protein
MTINCADCSGTICETGHTEAVPDNCPMRGDFPDFGTLYSPQPWNELAYQAAIIEAEGYGRWTRAHEIAELARRMEYRRLGVAQCVDMTREAELTSSFFHTHDLEPLLPPENLRSDPRGQAHYFAEKKTELNVLAGMCVGHDSIFIRASSAPVTSLIVRDTKLFHNPVAALYTSQSYFRKSLYYRHQDDPPRPYRGVDDATLDAVSRSIVRDGQGEWCRIEEIIEFARRLGISKMGIVFCSGFQNEARVLKRILEANDLTVSSSCCKTGSVPKEDMGILDEQKVRPGQPEMICNPLAQAELLNREQVELALLLGQCTGHDSATMAHLEAPAVCTVAKDRALAHNTLAALYR